MVDKNVLENAKNNHDIEFIVSVRIDNEIIEEVRSLDFEDVSSYQAENKLNEAVNNYLIDEVVSSEEDYYDRHSKEL